MKYPCLNLLWGLVLAAFVAAGPALADGDEQPPAPAPATKSWDGDYLAAVKAIEAEQYGRAIELLQNVLSVSPNNAGAHNYLGFAYRKKDRLQRAAAAYRTALRLDPNHKGALEYQGELFLRLGEMESARDNLERLSRLCPSGCEALTDLRRALAVHGARRGS